MRYDVFASASSRTFAIIPKLLEGNDTPGVDDEYYFDSPMKDFACTVWWEGTPTIVTVNLEGKINGCWVSLSGDQTFKEPGLLLGKGPVMAIRLRYVSQIGDENTKLYADCIAVR